MQKMMIHNDDAHIKKSNSNDINIQNNDLSIRFAFPERPSNQDYSHLASSSGCTLSCYHRWCKFDHWAEFPYFIASLFTIISTFVTVRAIVVNGYLVDHSSWDGTGHHYDQQPVVFLNLFETCLVSLSLICGLLTCLSIILKAFIYSDSLSRLCTLFAFINASCLLLTSILFYNRTLDLIESSSHYAYSRGFYSCSASGVLMLVAFCGFVCDRCLDPPDTGPLSIMLKAMVLPSVMYCTTLIFGTLVLIRLEHWEYSQAMMFCATALTTIGYGDVVPITPTGRIFFLVYATVGIGVVGYFLLSLRAVMINGSSANLVMKVNLLRVESLHTFTRAQRQRQRQRRTPFQQQKNPSTIPDTGDSGVSNKRVGDAFSLKQQQLSQQQSIGGLSTFSNYTLANLLNEECRQKWVHIVTYSGVGRMAILFGLTWFGGAAIFCGLEEHWTYLDGLYFSFATLSTIGFGDLVPQTAAAQEFWFVYIIISIAVAAYFISMLGDVLAEKLLIDNDGIDDHSMIDNNDDDEGDNDNNDQYRYTATGEMMEGGNLFRHDPLASNSHQETSDMQSTTNQGSTSSLYQSTRHCNNHQPRPYDYGSIRYASNDDAACRKKSKYSKHLPLAVTGAHCC
ncbi:hypothetical protein BC941DRAFT_468195 [Chlamydoabsidia padenii]|nr:hypothetical protein BC941DRAFT_468195 [Chlamydoabsidia padenii]